MPVRDSPGKVGRLGRIYALMRRAGHGCGRKVVEGRNAVASKRHPLRISSIFVSRPGASIARH